MWAVLYGWTPEIFGTKSELFIHHLFSNKHYSRPPSLVRGTACGIASALSRMSVLYIISFNLPDTLTP